MTKNIVLNEIIKNECKTVINKIPNQKNNKEDGYYSKK